MAGKEKRYWWLKLQENFFQQKEIRALRRRPNGNTLTIIYLKMQLFSLQHGGIILFEGFEDTFVEELAYQLEESPEDIERTVAFLKKHELLLELSPTEMQLPKVLECVGTEGSSARRMRKQKKKEMLKNDDQASNIDASTSQCNETASFCYGDIEKDIDTEKEIESETEKKKEIEKGIVNTPQAVHHPLFFEPQNEPQSGLQREEDDESIMTIRYFFTRYLIKTGQKHDPISAEKMEEIKRIFDETGVYRDYVDVYFGDEDHKGLCGDSDCKIFHFSSPGVLEVIKKRLT